MAKRKKDQTNKSKRQVGRTLTKKRPALSPKPKGVQKSQKTGLLSSSLKKISGGFLATLAVCGFLFGIYNYYPHVSIQETTLLQSYNPFYYPFIIKNTGKIKLKNFSFDLRAGDLVDIHNNSFKNFNVSGFSDTINKIKVDGSHPIDLSNLFVTPPNYFKSCKFFIRYKYSVTIFNIQFRDSIKFVLFKDAYQGYKWKEYQY